MTAPANLMLTQVAVIAQAAMQGVAGASGAICVVGQAQSWSAAIYAYCWNDDVIGREFAGPSVIRDTFTLGLHLLVREGAPATTETLVTELEWAILGAFRNNRRLNGTANTSWIRQGDAKTKAGALFTVNDNAFYRNKMFGIEAAYNSTYSYVNG